MISYPYIPDGREYKYVQKEDKYIEKAKEFALSNSTDRVQPTGSVVVKDGKVIGVGANKSAISNPAISKLHSRFCIRKAFRVKTGKAYWICPGCASSKSHSEARAIAYARKKGEDTRGADLYLWGHWWCCKPCWDAMISGGIKDVYLLEGSERFFSRDNPESLLGKYELSG